MRVTRPTPTLAVATRYGFVNAALVRDGEGTVTLVDAGLRGSAPALLDAARALSGAAAAGGRIARVALTHAHVDHVGSLDALAAALPGVEVAIGAREARLLAGDMALLPAEADRPLRGGFVPVTTRPTRLLADGDRVGALRAVATPGHTPGHFAFFDERDGTLIAGDALQTAGAWGAGVVVAGVPAPGFPISPFTTWDPTAALASAERIAALAPARLVTGHGAVLARPAAALARAVERARRRLDGRRPATAGRGARAA
ncbi:hypothetical protein tb265_19880 [Gemmatimonadetes bacterium T265]|nr:hypothetical protein tb265_19880 [Gemmatimonadetes bacterium T265]